MMQPGGDRLLRIIGKDSAARGIIEPAALPAAIKAVESAIAREERLRAQAAQASVQEDCAASHNARVTLRQRAWPLLEMMKSAHAAAREIVWAV
jgi:hypothetical protein